MSQPVAEARRSALTLAAFALGTTLLLGLTWQASHQIIRQNEQASLLATLSQVLPAGSFDNDLAASVRQLSAAQQTQSGSPEPLRYYIARKGTQASGIIMENTAPDGYSGRIKLLIGLDASGTVQAVRVVQHQETPGLGDYIESARSQWAAQFRGKAADAPASTWQVRKDGGEVDYVTGATISARAVSQAVGRSVATFARHRQTLLETP